MSFLMLRVSNAGQYEILCEYSDTMYSMDFEWLQVASIYLEALKSGKFTGVDLMNIGFSEI
jgi:hypothetical protein